MFFLFLFACFRLLVRPVSAAMSYSFRGLFVELAYPGFRAFFSRYSIGGT